MRNILVVDDSRFILAIVENAISKVMDVEIYTANSYERAEALVKSHHFDLAVLDVHLPDAERGEVIDLLNFCDVPVIVLTGGMNKKTETIILEKELIEYVTKSDPNTVGYVAAVAKRALSNYDKHVLIVDDSATARALMRAPLEAMKIQVHEAKDGVEALEFLLGEEYPVSLVLTDFHMPRMDGLDFTIALRQKFSKDQIGIIAITADEGNVVPNFLRHGANDCIKKPFADEELTARVNANLDLIDLFSEVREMANKDYMTGLSNRRYFFEHAKELLADARRHEKPLAVAMVDIDHFKNINDSYGHDIGDLAIKEAASILSSHVDDDEMVARFGGEEFCLLMQVVDQDEMCKRMEWLRSMFESNVITTKEASFGFTVSIGLCIGTSDDVSGMVKCADKLLYEAKSSGRNRVVSKFL
jgi:diguanylate cyclase (GGDEF)-like protein